MKNNAFLVILIAICSAFFLSCDNNNECASYLAVKLQDSEMWSILDLKTGKILYKDEFENISVILNDIFYVVNEDGSRNYYNIKDVKKPINKESFCDVTPFCKEGFALAVKLGEPISIIDRNCKEVVTLDKKIMTCSYFVNNCAIVQNNSGKYGYIDTKGKLLIPMKYDYASKFSDDGIAIVGKKICEDSVKYSAIDLKGNVLFDFTNKKYQDFNAFHDGYMPALKKNKIVFLDRTGNESFSIGKTENDYLPYNVGVYKNKVVFIDGDKYGIANTKGDIIIRAKYDFLIGIKNDIFIAEKKDKAGVINTNDKIIIPFDYDLIMYFPKSNNYLVGVYDEEDEEYTLINSNSKDVCLSSFSNVNLFYHSMIISYFFHEELLGDGFSNLTTGNWCD